MRTVTAAFEAGDKGPLLASIHPDIVWKSASAQDGMFGFSGVHKRRDGVESVTQKINAHYTFKKLRPKEIVEKKDVVWGLFDAQIDYNYAGQPNRATKIALEIAIHWRIKDGKIIEHQAFFDTAALLLQIGHPAGLV
jgi:ketosteroid isomerase-like protein